MNLYLALGFSLAVYIAGTLAAIKYKRLNSSFYPFVYFLWLACVNETVNVILILNNQQNSLNNNLYVLFEPLLLLLFFKRINLFAGRENLVLYLLGLIVTAWCAEVIFISSVTGDAYYYRITYALIIIIISVLLLNKVMMQSSRTGAFKVLMLLSICFIVYYTYKIVIDAFWMYGVNSQSNFHVSIYYIFIYVNLVINLLYALAVIWIPKKRGYTLP